jgi:hypothetical protein
MSNIFNNFNVLELGDDGNCFFYCISYIFHGREYMNYFMNYRKLIADNILEYISNFNASYTREIINEIFSESIVINNLSTERNIDELKKEIMNNLILSNELPKFINSDARIGYNFRGYKISCWAIEPFINILLEYIYSTNQKLSIIMFKCPLNKENQYLENLQIRNNNLNTDTKISILLHMGNFHYRFIEYNSNRQILLNTLPQIIQNDILNSNQNNILRRLNDAEIINYKKICKGIEESKINKELIKTLINSNQLLSGIKEIYGINLSKNSIKNKSFNELIKYLEKKLNISNNKNNVNSIINDITKQKPPDLKKALEQLFEIKIDKTNTQLMKMNYLEMKKYIKSLITQKNINTNINSNNNKKNNGIKSIENEIKEIIYREIPLQQKIDELQKNYFIKFDKKKIKKIEDIYQIKLEKLDNKQLYYIFINIIIEHLLLIKKYLSSESSNDSKILTIQNFIKEFYNKDVSKEQIRQILLQFNKKDIFTLLNIARIINSMTN